MNFPNQLDRYFVSHQRKDCRRQACNHRIANCPPPPFEAYPFANVQALDLGVEWLSCIPHHKPLSMRPDGDLMEGERSPAYSGMVYRTQAFPVRLTAPSLPWIYGWGSWGTLPTYKWKWRFAPSIARPSRGSPLYLLSSEAYSFPGLYKTSLEPLDLLISVCLFSSLST